MQSVGFRSSGPCATGNHPQAIAAGQNASCPWPNGIALGINSAVTGTYGVAVGELATADAYGFAFGRGADAGNRSVAVGLGANANTAYGVAVGSGITANGNVIIGRSTDSSYNNLSAFYADGFRFVRDDKYIQFDTQLASVSLVENNRRLPVKVNGVQYYLKVYTL